MQIKINLKIFIFLLIFILTRQIKIYALIMVFAFIHELGHLLAGIFMGLKPQSLEVAPYGFSISFKTDYYNYNIRLKKANILSLKRMVIAIAGPITNLFIIIITYIYSIINKNIDFTNIEMIIYSNILIFVFNMLPIYPLDGGRIIKEIIYIFKGLEQSYTYTNAISNMFIIILTIISSFAILIYKNIAIVVIIIYLWIIVIKENRYIENKRKIFRSIYCKKK